MIEWLVPDVKFFSPWGGVIVVGHLKIAYAEHPLHGSVVYVCRRIRTDAGEMAIVETANGLRRELPAWMLDAGYCAALTHGPAVVALPALQDLRVLLDSRLLDQRQSVDAESRAKENSPHGKTKTPQACSESPVAVPRPGGRVAAARGDVAGGRPTKYYTAPTRTWWRRRRQESSSVQPHARAFEHEGALHIPPRRRAD